MTIIRGQEKVIQELTNENAGLKQEIRKLQTRIEAQETSASTSRSNNVSNIDLLRRISQLEKIVYGKNE